MQVFPSYAIMQRYHVGISVIHHNVAISCRYFRHTHLNFCISYITSFIILMLWKPVLVGNTQYLVNNTLLGLYIILDIEPGFARAALQRRRRVADHCARHSESLRLFQRNDTELHLSYIVQKDTENYKVITNQHRAKMLYYVYQFHFKVRFLSATSKTFEFTNIDHRWRALAMPIWHTHYFMWYMSRNASLFHIASNIDTYQTIRANIIFLNRL